MAPCETPLRILSSDSPNKRVSVAMIRCDATGCDQIRLRQESFSDAVGWFTQSQIDLCPEQVAQLKAFLGPVSTKTL